MVLLILESEKKFSLCRFQPTDTPGKNPNFWFPNLEDPSRRNVPLIKYLLSKSYNNRPKVDVITYSVSKLYGIPLASAPALRVGIRSEGEFLVPAEVVKKLSLKYSAPISALKLWLPSRLV